jgi:hypothetical protein
MRQQKVKACSLSMVACRDFAPAGFEVKSSKKKFGRDLT